ncbi:MAG: OsmC family protein [Phycisphaerae bacterium]|nr:OsmC family protein [Phycisphaerae bacterium]
MHATARVIWQRNGQAFVDNRYSRGHEWAFDGGVCVPASSSPALVREPLSVAEAVDPEEALVAATASCHMLWFLSLAAQQGILVERYEDHPSCSTGKNSRGFDQVTAIVLKPRIEFGGKAAPSREEVESLHRQAHERCMIANSLRADVVVEAHAA